MATEKRLIYMDDTMDRLRAYADRKHQAGYTELANGILKAVNYIHNEIRRVDAVEVVHGQWIVKHNPITDPKGYFIRIVCSQCDLHTGQRSNYCPQCGAKMDGGDEDGC